MLGDVGDQAMQKGEICHIRLATNTSEKGPGNDAGPRRCWRILFQIARLWQYRPARSCAVAATSTASPANSPLWTRAPMALLPPRQRRKWCLLRQCTALLPVKSESVFAVDLTPQGQFQLGEVCWWTAIHCMSGNDLGAG